MSHEAAQQRREECRREVRRYLAERSALAFPVHAIRRKLRIDGDDFTDEEIEAATVFLAGMKHVDVIEEELGATKYYKATSAGVLAHERSR